MQTVNITDSYSGAVIHYTTDGSTPSTSSPVYASALTLSDTQTLQAIATAGSYANSLVATAVFNINLPADTPTFSPTPGTYPTAQSVTISDATPDATIYYTTDNSAPTTNSSVYTAPIAVASWETVEAVAIAPGSSVSVTGIAPYTIGNAEAAAPTFSPGAGTYASSQAVAISDETAAPPSTSPLTDPRRRPIRRCTPVRSMFLLQRRCRPSPRRAATRRAVLDRQFTPSTLRRETAPACRLAAPWPAPRI